VYYLYDTDGVCCYIGSSADLRERLKFHRHDGKQFSSWMAELHESRDAAYKAEAALLKAGTLPYLNRRAGR
jgi:predicted GIY-YIG superfamily endonuclease